MGMYTLYSIYTNTQVLNIRMSLCNESVSAVHCELACEPSVKLEVTKMSSNHDTENSLTVHTSMLKLNQHSAVKLYIG